MPPHVMCCWDTWSTASLVDCSEKSCLLLCLQEPCLSALVWECFSYQSGAGAVYNQILSRESLKPTSSPYPFRWATYLVCSWVTDRSPQKPWENWYWIFLRVWYLKGRKKTSMGAYIWRKNLSLPGCTYLVFPALAHNFMSLAANCQKPDNRKGSCKASI